MNPRKGKAGIIQRIALAIGRALVSVGSFLVGFACEERISKDPPENQLLFGKSRPAEPSLLLGHEEALANCYLLERGDERYFAFDEPAVMMLLKKVPDARVQKIGCYIDDQAGAFIGMTRKRSLVAYTDGSADAASGVVGWGVSFVENGRELASVHGWALTRSSRSCASSISELVAAQMAIALARQDGCKKLIIMTDCEEVIRRKVPPVREMKISRSHVPRKENLAHKQARIALKEGRTVISRKNLKGAQANF